MTREMPEVGDLVVVTVKEVQNYGAIVQLDEYPGVSGFIHIAEVATGWIKHIKDFVRVNQRTVCKVLNVDPNRRHVDLSLKRVNEHQKREKIEEWKNDQKSYKLLEIVAKEANISDNGKVKNIENYLISEYGSVYDAFFEAASSKDFMKDRDEPWKDVFIKVSKENISIPMVKIGGEIDMYSLASNGIELIKNALDIEDDDSIEITYAGSPRYRISVVDEDYKSAEEKLKNVLDTVSTRCKKNNISYSFTRDEQ
ncbi:MAG: translation initiation factor IF-2 subunit alpha [Ferroplasma sp.]|uniref:translation initiation factor IF-2 subunit alpha n=1 Tax=Ferroplasma sp. TaxID=2591003 RepID=UPI0028169AA1|nr:translation initiation factor IF-2 subunit alpha [Ferroplasma sp.]WMT51706.1 MAG: translation initiation factor IF-2 subunit alpha [Ferroplasma sp.]